MKATRAAPFVLVLLYACFLGYWAWSGTQLPERVATHFNAGGEPNGWMSRAGNQLFVLLFGSGFPLFFIGLCFATRFLPTSVVNLPNRQYWLAPERRLATSNYVFHHSFWLACLAVGFVLGIQCSIVQANRQSPPHLSFPVLMAVVVPFVVGTAVWVLVLFRHFRKPTLA